MYLEVYHLNCSADVDFKITSLVLSSCSLPFLSTMHFYKGVLASSFSIKFLLLFCLSRCKNTKLIVLGSFKSSYIYWHVQILLVLVINLSVQGGLLPSLWLSSFLCDWEQTPSHLEGMEAWGGCRRCAVLWQVRALLVGCCLGWRSLLWGVWSHFEGYVLFRCGTATFWVLHSCWMDRFRCEEQKNAD